jgi:DNA-binding winged helix-turn-helix (wHTH) protein
MFPSLSEQHPFSLADITVHPLTLTVRRGEQHIVLQQKPMEVLAVLVARHPALVSRDQLIELVWDGNIYVGEKALTHAIWQLRQLFEQLGMAEVISTVRKKGYRLLLTPQLLPPEALSLTPGPADVANTVDSSSLTASSRSTTVAVAAPAGSKVVATAISAGTDPAFWRLLVIALLFGLLCLLLWLGFSGPNHNQTLKPGVVVSRQQGWSLYPAVSRDGQLLVYSHQQYGQTRQLFALDLDDAKAQPRQLTFSPQHKFRPVLSPDGLQVYYSSRFSQRSADRFRRPGY